MVSQEIEDFVRQAERLYNERLRAHLEETHPDEFVAIEPISGEYFLGKTLSEAMGAAGAKYPDRPSHAVRVGHEAALHFGFSTP
jgi:hypothetical protein